MLGANRFSYRTSCVLLLLIACSRVLLAADAPPKPDAAAAEKDVTQGALRIMQPDGGVIECPLKHTDVKAEVAGFIARVRVTQTFHNPTKEKIEAVYVFPLPHQAAVDEMTMVVGDRKIVGLIKRRADARAIYEEALRAGQMAALLEQERPNIFTQSVGNIEPGQEVKIEIAYVDVLRYDLGTYEFQFPMVVGPRYIPGNPIDSPQPHPNELKSKVSPPVGNTDRVPDASRISPPVMKPGHRSGHDISLSVKLDAGVPIQDLTATNHKADIVRDGDHRAAVKLSPTDSLPNKDFVLRYGVVGKKPEMAVLAHTGDYSLDRRQLGNGYFLLMIQPQEDERLKKSPPREMVFLVDVSGSMSGEPTAKVIETMQAMLKLCRPQDTVQVVTFASHAQELFEKPVPVTEENISKALHFTSGLRGGGGTEMLKGVKLAIDAPIDRERMRIVVMLTDGYIGNEAEIIEHVGKNCGDQIRFWCVGIGSSPNMFLVDGVARQGGGMGKQLGLNDVAQPLATEIMTRIQRAQLAKIKIDWGDLKISETYPAKLPELWAGRPVIVIGRYAGGGAANEGTWQTRIKVSGSAEGEAVEWPLDVKLPQQQAENEVLAKTWARHKIEDLMQQSFYQGSPAVEEMVTSIALDYRLMSQYTSFVAVDAKDATATEHAHPPRRMLVPVPLPEGTRWEGFFGDREEAEVAAVDALSLAIPLSSASVAGLVPALQPSAASAEQATNWAIRPARDAKQAFGFRGAVSERAIHRLADPVLRVRTAGGMAAGFGGAAVGSPAPGGGEALGRRVYKAVDLGKSTNGYFQIADNEARLEQLVDKAALGGERELTALALVTTSAKLSEAARAIYESATSEKSPPNRDDKRFKLVQACLLDTAAANLRQSDGSTAVKALEQIEQLHRESVREWSERIPALKTRLNLVLRDRSLEEAMNDIAKAAGISINLLPGSAVDSAALLGDSPRVHYLDLRGATVAEALDWLLQPLKLMWWADKDSIAVASERRRGGSSGWIYDVSALALPLADELNKSDQQKARAEAQRAADDFLAAVKQKLGAGEEHSVAWFEPGKLVVFGRKERHEAMSNIIAGLQTGDLQSVGVPRPIAEQSSRRYEARKNQLAEAQRAHRRFQVAAAHNQFSWQLLAAAAAGELDEEAITELEIAWKSPETAELLKGSARPLVLRSLWAVSEAAAALPDQREFQELATAARPIARSAITAAFDALEKDSENVAAIRGAIWAALAVNDNADYRSKALRLLNDRSGGSPTAVVLRKAGRALLTDKPEGQLVVAELLTENASDADSVALVALACRRTGEEVWNEFRAASREFIGSHPLPGDLVVLVNRLSMPALKLVATKK
jgi:Ca-activated chloride channel family protein